MYFEKYVLFISQEKNNENYCLAVVLCISEACNYYFFCSFFVSETIFFKECIIQITIHAPNLLSWLEEKSIKQIVTFTLGERSYSLVLSTMVKSKWQNIFLSLQDGELWSWKTKIWLAVYSLPCHICNQQNYTYSLQVWTS